MDIKLGDSDELVEPLLSTSAIVSGPRTSFPENSVRHRETTNNMPPLHKLMLSPWEKWHRYKRFPWKLLCHILLMICCTAQILLYSTQYSAYIRASYRNWAYFFLPHGSSVGRSKEVKFEECLYTANETLYTVSHIRNAYYNIPNTSIANYEFRYDEARLPLPIRMFVTTVNAQEFQIQEYNVSNRSLGPFDELNTTANKLKYIRSIQRISFFIPLRDIDAGSLFSGCFDWDVNVELQKIQSSHFRLKIVDSSLRSCSAVNVLSALRRKSLWLNVLIILLCCAYLGLSLKAIYCSFARFSKASKYFKEVNWQKHSKEGRKWIDIPFYVQLRFFNTQYVLISLSLIFLVINAFWNISSMVAHVPLSLWHRFLQSIGPLLIWFTFVGYLEHNQKFYSIVLTLRWGIPKVAYFLVGVSPIFFGYAMFGAIMFGHRVEGFAGLQQACVTLFSIMNGDIIIDTFDSLKWDFPFVGAVYIYSFISLFVYVVLNIFIAIVEEAFFATRSYKRALDVLSTGMFPYEDFHQKQQEVTAEAFRLLLEALEKDD